MGQLQFNEHNKEEHKPSHTCEHLLNQTMIRLFGCKRSENAHIERKKSKIAFILENEPSEQQIEHIVEQMQKLIADDLPVSYQIVDRNELPEAMKCRLPENVSSKIRLVRIGDYDVCPCIGAHVSSTSQIGNFILLGTNWDASKHQFRIRFKLENTL